MGYLIKSSIIRVSGGKFYYPCIFNAPLLEYFMMLHKLTREEFCNKYLLDKKEVDILMSGSLVPSNYEVAWDLFKRTGIPHEFLFLEFQPF